MTLNKSIHYQDNALFVDGVVCADIIEQVGTPTYVYSLPRALDNLARLRQAFPDCHIHYSAKANANLAVLSALINAGAGVDAVSGGEIFKALKAGCAAENIVFAGVGKSPAEIHYALEQGVGWFNVENVAELDTINRIAESIGRDDVQVALRFNPDVTANTHPYIATGHGGAKFGLTAAVIAQVLSRQGEYEHINFAGIHVHIGSQLHDTRGTVEAIEKALELITLYPDMRYVNIGGGLPAPYQAGEELPSFADFAQAALPLLKGYQVMLEPGRSIIGDAGLLLTQVLYIKQQAGQNLVIVDASMTELIRPALYQATHAIVPTHATDTPTQATQIVGPVCETADVLGRDVDLPLLKVGDSLAILTAGAYGAVMASNYNARPRPAEVVISADGQSWHVSRRRETWEDLVALE